MLPLLLGVLALAVIAGWWTWRAVHDPRGYDFRLAYRAGQVSWATGQPEHQSTWDGTPLLAALLALITRVMSQRAAASLLTVFNLGLVVGCVLSTLRGLRGLSLRWRWAVAAALVTFGPILSTVWWKQFNIVALSLALSGFLALRRQRSSTAGALLGLSVSVKPIVFLLPIVLLARRETRRAGLISVAWIAVLNLAGQALLAARAGRLAALDPLVALQNFLHKTRAGGVWGCLPENFSPGAELCRAVGRSQWVLQRGLVIAFVLLLGALTVWILRERSLIDWETLAFTCPLSVMVSPLAWTHYQIALVPLFVLLLVRLDQEGAHPLYWLGLATAFALASLMWKPYGTIIGGLGGLFGYHESLDASENVAQVAQLAQYVLLGTALIWYARHRVSSAETRFAQPHSSRSTVAAGRI